MNKLVTIGLGILFLLKASSLAAQVRVCITRADNGFPVQYHPVTLRSNGQDSSFKTNNSGCIRVPLSFTNKNIQLLVGKRSYSLLLRRDTSLAYTSITTLPKVVLTSQIKPQSVDSTVNKVRVISRQRIEEQAAPNPMRLPSNELNISISNDAVLGSQISLNGLSGQHVKILRDGVPVIGRQDGNLDLSQINLNNVERIEIVEGPQSTVYGTEAYGGGLERKEEAELVYVLPLMLAVARDNVEIGTVFRFRASSSDLRKRGKAAIVCRSSSS